MTNEKELLTNYRSYGKRWMVLLVVILLNMTGAMVSMAMSNFFRMQ